MRRVQMRGGARWPHARRTRVGGVRGHVWAPQTKIRRFDNLARCVARRSRTPYLRTWALVIALAGRDAAAAAGAASGRAPERGATPPAEEPNARSSSEVFRQLGLGNRDEAGAHPDTVEPLGAGVDGVHAIGLRL